MKQPDLIPGVRDEERPTPTLAAPFALRAQFAKVGGRQRLLGMDDVPSIRYEGACRYCRSPRPVGYPITCGRSACQEAAYRDKEQR